MRSPCPFRLLLLCTLALGLAPHAAAVGGPPNPYSGFNLSGVNYGAQQWDRAQREGRVVWPYYNVPSRRSSHDATVGVGSGGAGGGFLSSARVVRRWRR